MSWRLEMGVTWWVAWSLIDDNGFLLWVLDNWLGNFSSGLNWLFEMFVFHIGIDFFLNEMLLRFMYQFLVLFDNNFLFFLVDDWLMDFMNMLLVDDWLMNFVNNRLMMFMNDLSVLFNDNILMMLMDNILMLFFNYSSLNMSLNNWSHNVFLNLNS